MTVNYRDWLRQARRDLNHAHLARSAGDYEWSCFAAQQSAEKAVKALFLKMNYAAWGHSVSALLQQLPDAWQANEELIQAGKELDKHYIPARYPNSYPQGAPLDYYTEEEANRAIGHSEQIFAFCTDLLDQP